MEVDTAMKMNNITIDIDEKTYEKLMNIASEKKVSLSEATKALLSKAVEEACPSDEFERKKMIIGAFGDVSVEDQKTEISSSGSAVESIRNALDWSAA